LAYLAIRFSECSVRLARLRSLVSQERDLFTFSTYVFRYGGVGGRKLYRIIPTERPLLVGEVIANFFADRGCHVVSVTDPYGRILDFLDKSRYFSIK
jgi:hypothetical protein